MGADNLAEMEKWHRWREIFGLFPIAVVDRPGWRLKALASKPARAYAGRRLPEADAKMLAHTPPPAWTFLTGPLSTLSSTALRAKAKRRNEVVAKKAQPGELPWRGLRNGAAAAPGPEPAQPAEHVGETAPVQGS
jgi:nicotinate-nucleotide adenylyltransferase